MEFRTKVDCVLPDLRLRPETRVDTVGSCFAEHVGERMAHAGFDVRVNPYGVLYNPLSIAMMCRTMVTGELPEGEGFFERDGLCHCWWVDSGFSAESRETCEERMREASAAGAERLKTLDLLCLTLGTNRYYTLSDGRVVGNCHKQPGTLFTERMLTVDETVAALDSMLEALWTVRPSLQVLFTVSPYRYAKYGFHGSQSGKAVLLLAVDELCRRHAGRCFYFPAYEIVLDELRDYRFYAEDMLHPSQVAVDYVWERFAEACFTTEARTYAAACESVHRALSHRPLHPETLEYRNFLRKTLLKVEQLKEKYPSFAFPKEYGRLKALL